MLTTVRHLVRRSWLKDGSRRLSVSNVRRSGENPSDGSGGDDSKKNAKNKLNSLLQSIFNDDLLSRDDPKKQVTAPRPLFREKKVKERSERNLGEKIVHAAKEVARNLDGDPEKNAAEILHKVVDKNVILRKSVFKASSQATLSLLLNELKVEKQQKIDQRGADLWEKDAKANMSRADMMRPYWKGKSPKDAAGVQPQAVDLFGSPPLGIFRADREYNNDFELYTWNQCSARELKFAFTQPPRNIWEQMIQWTERGLLWKFPIDNEQGIKDDSSFVEHVFLENYLDDWCPKSGPIRHFMELVCVGLSRNHWLNAEEKRDHMMWYKEYFLSKKSLLKEIGAGEIAESSPSAQL